MNLISDFIKENDADAVENTLGSEELKKLFAAIFFEPGAQFMEFVRRYSYLAYEDVEFFGINSELKEKSNLFARTKILVENYETLKGYYIIESRGDGYYVLVDSEDNVYNFFAGDSEKPESAEIKLYDYILKRFEEAELQ